MLDNYDIDEKSIIEILALSPLSYEAMMFFEDFFEAFNIRVQISLRDKSTFTEKEYQFLLDIYFKMNELYSLKKKLAHDSKIDMWNEWTINDFETKQILKYVEKFLSLPSMERFMKEIRKNSYYKGIGDFY